MIRDFPLQLSVIIINYNTPNLLLKCIESIYTYTKDVTFEVIVVDNASTDNSIKLLSQEKRIKLIKSTINLGFGKANNLGLKYTKGKYIFLLNSDTYLLNNALKLFYDAIEQEEKNVCCIGTLLKCKDEKTINNSYSSFPSIRNTFYFFLKLYFKYSKDILCLTPPFYVDYIIGADLLIRREVIEEYGFFDPDFFMYFEESELQLRYTKAGFRSKIVSGPEIVHLEGGSFKDKNKLVGKKAEMYFSSMNTYMRKRYVGFKWYIWKLLAIGYIPIILKNEKSLCRTLNIIKKLLH